MVSEATSTHNGGIAVFFRKEEHFYVEVLHLHGANGISFQLVSGGHWSYVDALGPMGLYGPITTLWNGGADQLKFPVDQSKLHGCVHFTK